MGKESIVGFAFDHTPYLIDNYESYAHPVKRQYRRMRGQETAPYVDPDVHDSRTHEDKGYILRKRSEVRPDEEIVEVVRHRGERLPRRPGMPRQSSSLDDMRRGRDDQRMVPYKGKRDESEGSVPPRAKDRGRAQSANGKGKSNRDSSTDTSDLGSTTDDERKCRKVRRKKWITAGLAGVATIHAAANVYSSVEKHDQRIIAVEKGELSPEEARKKQRQAQWQDVASIAIAALGIKGAVSEWSEVKEEAQEHNKLLSEREERHKKRREHERRKQSREQNHGYYKGRDGNWYYDGEGQQGRSNDSPRQGGDSQRRQRSQSRKKPALLGAIEDF